VVTAKALLTQFESRPTAQIEAVASAMRGQYSNQVFFESQWPGYAIFELEHGAIPNPDHGSKLGKVAFSNVVADEVARG
jgi:hypothetical protein